MKKFFVGIVALVLSAFIGTAGLFGCGLVTTDNDKEMMSVVATIDIGEKQNVYKKDIASAYMNYGYVYEQYYGWSSEQTIEFIVNSLVNSRVLVQSAMIELDKNGTVANSSISDKFNPERYLDKDEIIDAKYSTYQSINNLLDSYAEEEAKKQDTSKVANRAVPTNATNEEITTAEKEAYIKKGFDVDGDRNTAFKQVVRVLDTNGLLGDYKGTLETTEYYKNLLKQNQESLVLAKFEEDIQSKARATVDFATLNKAYIEDLNTAKEYDETAFAEAMSSATAENPLLYGAYGNYGYVYNLLLGVNEYQSAEIKTLDTKLSNQERMAARKTILAETTATDLRDSWIYSGYDNQVNGSELKFTGDYTFNSQYSLPFQGAVKLLEEKEDGQKVYGIDSKKTFSLPEFVSFVENYLYGSEMADAGWSGNAEYTDAIYKVVNQDASEGYTDKINELLFAFSTDDGSLNTYKGYAVSPKPNGTSTETYMAEFAEASRELFKLSGKNSYIIVATDYGYHFVFFSKVFSLNNNGAETLADYLTAEYGKKTWEDEYKAMLNNWEDYEDKDNYLYLLANRVSSSLVSTKLQEYENGLLNKYRYESDKYVKVFEDVYADLIQ